MVGPSATQHAPKSLLELEDLLKDDIKVKVAGKRGSQRQKSHIMLIGSETGIDGMQPGSVHVTELIPYTQSMGC